MLCGMRTWLVAAALLVACDPVPPPRPPEVRAADDAAAITALRAGRFADAQREASAQLARDPRDAQVAAVRALATYVQAGDKLAGELHDVIERADAVHYFDHEQGRAVWMRFLEQLDAVDRDLAVAADDPQFSLELCVACWGEHDWNHNGQIDDRDRKLFEVETDEKEQPIPEGDPRRRPTFRFDAGDLQWARAMVAFQHAGVELVLAYRWSELDKLWSGKDNDGEGARIVIHMIDSDRVVRARKDLLAGLDFSAAERAAYLAETDDDREWVPNPHQHNAGMMLPIDDELYRHWDEILGDAHKLLDSEEGLSLREMARVIDRRAALITPDAYIDLGRMLREPQDIVIDIKDLDKTPAGVEKVARQLIGHGYVEQMRASPLVGRIRLMVDDVSNGADSFEHKLRYLMYLN
jgi:hypothetical protein